MSRCVNHKGYLEANLPQVAEGSEEGRHGEGCVVTASVCRGLAGDDGDGDGCSEARRLGGSIGKFA